MTIIGIVGKIGTGKTTVADYLVSQHGFIEIAHADILKQMVALMGYDFEMLRGKTPEYRLERETQKHPLHKKTGREMLQTIGVLLRDHIDKDIWLNLVYQKIDDILTIDPTADFVISDCRFPNEMQKLNEQGGSLWIMIRNNDSLVNDNSRHISERAFFSELTSENIVKYNYTYITNTSTEADLFKIISAKLNSNLK
jgi:hypothetical protein